MKIAANPSKHDKESYTSCEEDDPDFLLKEEEKEVEAIANPKTLKDIKQISSKIGNIDKSIDKIMDLIHAKSQKEQNPPEPKPKRLKVDLEKINQEP